MMRKFKIIIKVIIQKKMLKCNVMIIQLRVNMKKTKSMKKEEISLLNEKKFNFLSFGQKIYFGKHG